MVADNIIIDLETWYYAQCDDEWEHEFGIQIGTLDNPGWYVKIDLVGTILESKELNEISMSESEYDWIHCKVKKKVFEGHSDPFKLLEILRIFLDWAKSENNWLDVPPSPTQNNLDRKFYESLSVEIGPEECTEPSCSRKRIKYSKKCRIHHFKIITGRDFSGEE
jgi:Immunity protein 53